MSVTRLPKTIYLLSLCNAFMYVCASLLITISALIGFELAPNKNLSTLPMALQFFAIMYSTIPASYIMSRIGRKKGFLLAGVIGIAGACLALWSIFNQSFIPFCIATLCFGTFTAFANYYRFTAAEVVDSSIKARAISMVMAGGVIAAFIGPNLANWSSHFFTERFAGPFAVLIIVYMLSMLTISFAKLPGPIIRNTSHNGRSLGTIVSQPIFIIAVICQMFGYGTMNLVMTSTPLAMATHDYGLGATAMVIQWHVVAMFLPSFITGHLISRIGIVPVLSAGVLIGIVCILINLNGETRTHFVSSLFLLGVSWNFLYVGGTTLLTDTYRPEEKPRAQGINDFIVFTTVTITALSAGGLHYTFGWQVVNLSAIPLLGITALAVIWLVMHRRQTPISTPV